ncbi:MAG TPA: IS1595 family transposase [Pelagibacterium sp.]|uniref:IS1595 family transposase n=1 Tax=uncultured Pelagibacterium sp. TaxID=1159875 RepID=UPI000C4FDB9C|nr:IS1595 family transposase [Pelagibacterium sp.]HCO55342.1 IS1595 family transposase [Pelagibacterium sp.]|tara:strand:- start:12506 stop:13462 length:957 start_codon:yes stop_codon:yes gene_type:complete
MAQHFLLSAQARTLSLRDIYKGGEEKAYDTFKAMRWADGEPVCPKCGCFEAYEITTRRKFKCKGCYAQFSVTSGTIFASRKMAFVDLLAAICIFVNAVKGLSALQFSRDLDVQYKTAFVLAHKLREALAAEVENATLEGEVEIDGAYFGGHIRPANFAEDRVDRRLAKHQTGTRRVVIALRQRKGRTRTFVATHEGEGVAIASQIVSRKSVIYADEAGHWDRLHEGWPTGRINHSEAYSADGTNTNQVESYFSRLRRMVTGQHHGVSPKYLGAYSAHAAWLEDHRRRDNGGNALAVVANAMTHPVSRVWKGYWQRNAA